MITLFQFIILLAFIWLGYETKWLTIRLGAVAPITHLYLSDSAVTSDMRHELLGVWFGGKAVDKILRCHFDQLGAQPLFGWGFAYQYKDFKPEYKIELLGPGYKTTIVSENTNTLRDAFRVNRNPWIKIKLA